jgi:hypothetical protein
MTRLAMVIAVSLVGASLLLSGCCPSGGCPSKPMDWHAKPPGSDKGGA